MSKTEHTGGRVLLALGVLLAALFILSFRLGQMCIRDRTDLQTAAAIGVPNGNQHSIPPFPLFVKRITNKP